MTDMSGVRHLDYRHGEDDARTELLPLRPDAFRPQDPLLGIGSFAPEFWRLVADPATPVPRQATKPDVVQRLSSPEAPVEEITVVASRPTMRLTDDEIANAVFNETVSLTGPDVDEMRRQMAQTIMNADEAFGPRRKDWTKTAKMEITRTISPLEKGRLETIRKNVTEARERFSRGEDPTNLATNYMKREDTGGPPSIEVPRWADDKAGLRLESIQGPFPDSQANREPAKHVYFWQNKLADKYYGRQK